MILNLALLVVELWFLSAFTLYLHHASRHFGLIPFLAFLVALVVVMRLASALSIYIRLDDYLNFTIAGNLFVPVTLMAVLLVYISEGTATARLTIYSIIGINFLVLALLAIEKTHLMLPAGASFAGTVPENPALSPPLQLAVASSIAFLVDLVVIAIVYQKIMNRWQHLPPWAAPGIALTLALSLNSIVFTVLSSTSLREVIDFLPGDLVGKAISGLLLWPLLGFYMTHRAVQIDAFRTPQDRPTLDLIFGSYRNMQVALNRSEAALRESQEHFRQLTENISEVFWLTTPDLHHAYYVSPAYEKIWGQPYSNVHDNPSAFKESIHPDDVEALIAAMPKQLLGTYDEEYRIVRPDGEIRWVRDRAFPISNEQGKIYRVAGIVEDITQRKQAEEQRFALALEQEKVKMLRDFISEISHDLKNPLAGIGMKIEIIAATDTADQRQIEAASAQSQIVRLGQLIDNLLTLSRLENTAQFQQQRLDLNHLLSEISKTNQAIAESKRQALNLELAPDLPPVSGNEAELTRAFTNLVDNAMRYTLEGGRINIHTHSEDNRVRVQISDTGMGISEVDLPHIFQRFYRSQTVVRKRQTGTGLGLAIVKTIIEKHDGAIAVQSTPGQGTIFTVELPVVIHNS